MRLALATLPLLALTACGGSGESADASPTQQSEASTSPTAATPTPAPSTPAPTLPAPEDELEQAYRDYVDAFLTGDGATSYALLSRRCQDVLPLSEFAAVTEYAAETYGLVEYDINSVEVRGKRGEVDGEFPVEAINQGGGSLWVLERGAWRNDKCD